VRGVLGEFSLRFGEGSESDAQLAALPGSYTDHGGAFWVATLPDGSLVGTCGVFPLEPGRHELRKMYLAQAARGLGLGRRLLEVAVTFARTRGATELVLDTTEQMTRAIAFYEASGFVRDDRYISGARCSRGYRRPLL
jgi:putative acetyltransferase